MVITVSLICHRKSVSRSSMRSMPSVIDVRVSVARNGDKHRDQYPDDYSRIGPNRPDHRSVYSVFALRLKSRFKHHPSLRQVPLLHQGPSSGREALAGRGEIECRALLDRDFDVSTETHHMRPTWYLSSKMKYRFSTATLAEMWSRKSTTTCK